MKIIFLGTPDFASSVLESLIKSKHEIVAVVTQPDKAIGRSNKLKFPAVKELAIKHNLKVLQYKRIKNETAINELKSLNADIMVTAAYGQILSQKVLDITSLGVYNVHGSLLPKYRGAAPIQWAVINGEKTTGITIMKTDIGMDTGAMFYKKEVDISPTETAGDVFEKLSQIGGNVLLEALELIETKTAKLEVQNETEATHFPMLKKEDGLITWSKNAKEIVNLVRGVNPWPGAYTFVKGELLKVWEAKAIEVENIITIDLKNSVAGEVLKATFKLGLLVKSGDNQVVELVTIQTFGGKRMSSKAYLNGKKIEEGTVLGE